MPSMGEILKDQKTEMDGAAVDTDSLSLAQIRDLALKQAADEKPADASKRDDKGRFVKPEAEEQPVEADQEDEAEDDTETIYRKVVDLGDGSGKQVFEGATPDEVMEKLVEAQKHATKKIREQAAELKTLKEQKPAPKQTQEDADDEFTLSQDILRKPTEAVKKAFKKATGLDISEFKSLAERVQAIDAAQAQQSDLSAQTAAANDFVAAHPEYVANQANGVRLNRAVDLLVREAKAKGESIDYGTLLTKAYDDLKESGLLTLKSNDADNEADGATEAAKDRIDSRTGQKPSRTGSSLAGRTRNAPAPKTKTLTEDELYNLSPAKLRELALKQA